MNKKKSIDVIKGFMLRDNFHNKIFLFHLLFSIRKIKEGIKFFQFCQAKIKGFNVLY